MTEKQKCLIKGTCRMTIPNICPDNGNPNSNGNHKEGHDARQNANHT